MWQFESQVSEVIQRTESVKSFRFLISTKNVRYRSGQFFFLTIKVNGEDALHHFSFSSSPTEKGYIEFTKRITSSDFSKALDALSPGDWASLQGPEGSFTLPLKQKRLAFLSGGIGITPLRSMLRYVVDKGLDYDIVLLYGNSTVEEIAFRQELDGMARAHRGIRVEHVLSAPNLPASWKGKRGYINGEIIRDAIPDFKDRLFYISGPPKMVISLQEQLDTLGTLKKQVRHDSFTGYD
jgi:glycine betaine catabolism B